MCQTLKQELMRRSNHLISNGLQRQRRVQQFFYCWVCIHYRGNVFTELLPSNTQRARWYHTSIFIFRNRDNRLKIPEYGSKQNSGTSFLSKKKITSRNHYATHDLRLSVSRYTSPSNEVTYLSAGFFVTMRHSALLCVLKTQCTAGGSCDRMIMEYTHVEYCNMLLILGTCNNRADNCCKEIHATLSWSTLSRVYCVSTSGAESLYDRKCTTYGTREYRSPINCTDTSQWRVHNWSCGSREVEKLTRYRKITGSLPTESPRSTSWRSVSSIPLLAERTFVPRLS
jgi:hypothetical protein